jgi:hypothetical protein
MESQGSRSKILNKIKQALKDPVAVPFPEQVSEAPIFLPTEEELTIDLQRNLLNCWANLFMVQMRLN